MDVDAHHRYFESIYDADQYPRRRPKPKLSYQIKLIRVRFLELIWPAVSHRISVFLEFIWPAVSHRIEA